MQNGPDAMAPKLRNSHRVSESLSHSTVPHFEEVTLRFTHKHIHKMTAYVLEGVSPFSLE